MGPWAYIQHLASTPRLPFTAAYFGSLGLTIYFSIGVGFNQAIPLWVFLANRIKAPKHYSYSFLGHYSAGLPGVVPCELFPDGLEWITHGQLFRGAQSSNVDDKLRKRVIENCSLSSKWRIDWVAQYSFYRVAFATLRESVSILPMVGDVYKYQFIEEIIDGRT